MAKVDPSITAQTDAAKSGQPKTAPASRENYYAFDRSYRKDAGGLVDLPLLMYTRSDEYNPIFFWINPSELQWRIATRTSIEQINGGAVHHEWRSIGVGSQSSQKFDQPVINFAFQSGLIMPNGTVEAPGTKDSSGGTLQDLKELSPSPIEDARFAKRMPQGIGNFYDFLEILNRPNVLPGGDPNYVVINYASPLFPFIQLEGFFTAEGVQWTEQADNPNMIVGWGASFVVFRSDPPLFDGGALHRQYLGTMPFGRLKG